MNEHIQIFPPLLQLFESEKNPSSRDLGIICENFVCSFLQERKETILYRNFRTRYGEIDIISQNAKLISFVEVRSKTSTAFGDPVETVSFEKQRKIIQTAQAFLSYYGVPDNLAIRFDIASIRIIKPESLGLTYFENAFNSNE